MQQNNKNDMISDAERQRQEEIRLKKIKQGLIEDTESQEYQQRREKEKNTPMTPSEKLQNFWYHNKVPTIVISFIVIVSLFFTYQMITKPKYDTTVLFCSFTFLSEGAQNSIANEMSNYVPDINDNGKVEVGVLLANYTSEDEELTGMEEAYQARIMSEIMAGKNNIFILEKQICEYYKEQGVLADLTDLIGIEGDKPVYSFSVKDTDLLKDKFFTNIRDNCVVAMRVHKTDTSKENYNAQVEAIKKIYESTKK